MEGNNNNRKNQLLGSTTEEVQIRKMSSDYKQDYDEPDLSENLMELKALSEESFHSDFANVALRSYSSDVATEESDKEEEDQVMPAPRSLPMEILLKLFGYLDRSSILDCRSVNMFWKDAADESLARKALSKSTDPYFIERFMKATDCAEWVAQNVCGNWFTSTEVIVHFLEKYGDSSLGNPFPSRTIILYFPCLNQCETPKSIQSFTSELRKNILSDVLGRFVEKFKQEIWTCYLIFASNVEVEKVLFNSIFGLKQLKSLTVYHSNWQVAPIIRDESFVDKLPRLEKLDSVQILGADGSSLYENVFVPGGYHEQIKNLRIGPDTFRPIIEEDLVIHPCVPRAVSNNLRKPPYPFLYMAPKLRKLVLQNPCANEIHLLSKSLAKDVRSELEEFSVALTSTHVCSSSSLIGNVLRSLDEFHATTLKKLYFHIMPVHFKRVSKQSLILALDGTSRIEYPNVKTLTISHSIVRDWPVLLKLLVKKCPNLERIVFRGQLNYFGKFSSKPKNEIEKGFLKYCVKNFFDTFPDAVKVILVPELGLKAIRPTDLKRKLKIECNW